MQNPVSRAVHRHSLDEPPAHSRPIRPFVGNRIAGAFTARFPHHSIVKRGLTIVLPFLTNGCP